MHIGLITTSVCAVLNNRKYISLVTSSQKQRYKERTVEPRICDNNVHVPAAVIHQCDAILVLTIW